MKAIKLPPGVDQTFIDEVEGLSIPDLKAKIVELQIHNQENEVFKLSEDYLSAAEEYSEAKERWGYVDGPVKEVTVAIKNKTKIVVDTLKDKGV